ncbi:MAG: long-chain fatty acid transport protein, partial [Pseudomonadota bacterium]|nr:long-chain fatty acid transport protein [Pseudomonadota bacterium]
SGSQFMDFFPTGTQSGGTAGGTMLTAINGAVMAGMIDGTNPVNTARFDFSYDSDFTGEATSTGYGAKIGFVAREGKLTIGGAYHFKTSLGDMKTSNGSMTMNANFSNDFLDDGTINSSAAGSTAFDVPVTGSVSVVDFQWPATLGVGAAYQVSDKLMVAVDVKQIMWSDVMDSFRLAFTADATQADPMAAGFAGTSVDFEMYQDWKDQTAIQFGAAYKMDDTLTLRAGMNLANNPCPDAYMNALFPAIEENHITAGVGYKMADNQGIDFALMNALEVDQVNGAGIMVQHSQLSWQLMYTYNF